MYLCARGSSVHVSGLPARAGMYPPLASLRARCCTSPPRAPGDGPSRKRDSVEAQTQAKTRAPTPPAREKAPAKRECEQELQPSGCTRSTEKLVGSAAFPPADPHPPAPGCRLVAPWFHTYAGPAPPGGELQRNSWAQQPSRRLIRTPRHPAVASSRPGFIPTRVRHRRVENYRETRGHDRLRPAESARLGAGPPPRCAPVSCCGVRQGRVGN